MMREKRDLVVLLALVVLATPCACRRFRKNPGEVSVDAATSDAAARGPTSTEADRRGSLSMASGPVDDLPAAPTRIDRVVQGRWPTWSVRANDAEAWIVFDRETEPVASAAAIATLLGTSPAFERMTFAVDDPRFPRATGGDAGAYGHAAIIFAPSEGTEVSLAKAMEKDPRAVTEYLASRYLTGRGDSPLLQTPQGKIVDPRFGDAFTQLASGAAHPAWRFLQTQNVSPEFVKKVLALDESALASLQDARGNAVECGVVRRHLVMQRRHELLSRLAP